MDGKQKLFHKNRKLVLRFLKETGMLKCWEDYLKSDERYKSKIWYEYIDPIDIIGSTYFTSFLKHHKGIKISHSFYIYFLLFLGRGPYQELGQSTTYRADAIKDFPNLETLIDG